MARFIWLSPLVFLPITVFAGATALVQMDRADHAEHNARDWEKVARDQGSAMRDLIAADARLKAANDRLIVACKASQQ